MQRHIFLSYSRTDVEHAMQLYRGLTQAGFRVWIDQTKLEPGTQNWQQAISDAIDAATCMVVVLTPSARAKEWVNWEIECALNPPEGSSRGALAVFPLIVYGTPEESVPAILGHVQWFNAGTKQLYDPAFQQLKKALQDHLGTTIPTARRWKTLTALLAVSVIILGVLLGFAMREPPQYPDTALIGLRYLSEDYNPRIVDLRTASTEGVPARAGYALEIDQIWAWASRNDEAYTINAEIYANDTFIGATEAVPLQEGSIQLGGVIPHTREHGNIENAWMMQDDWGRLTIVLVLYREGMPVHAQHFPIEINPNGTAWVWDTPRAHIVSVTYAVNDSLPQILDLRVTENSGINAGPGDTITLYDVWYKSDSARPDVTIKAEAYLTPGGYDGASEQYTRSTGVQRGLHALDEFEPLTWQVRDNDTRWVLSLSRDGDQTLLDRYVIQLNATTSPGLVSSTSAIVWANENEYQDFEADEDLAEWEAARTATIARSADHAFTGGEALAVTTTSGAQEDDIKVYWNRTIKGETIVGQVYWPIAAGIELQWAQACAWGCVPIDLNEGQWNTFTMDLSEIAIDDTPLNEVELPQFWIQFQADGITSTNPYTFFIDGIQFYPRRLR